MNLSKNDIIKLNITSASSEGSGIGKTDDGQVVFVPNSAIGDELMVRVLKVKKNCVYGKIEEIVAASKKRIEPDCPYFTKCGGCVLRHISYDEELRYKSQKVYDALTRIGKAKDFEFENIIPCENINNYRNKAQLPIGVDKENNILMGFYAFHSHRIIDCESCNLQPKIFTAVMDITRKFISENNVSIYNETTHKGSLRHLYIRYAEVTKELMVCYVVNGKGLENENGLVKVLKENLPCLKSVIINTNKKDTNVVLGNKNRVIFGQGYITDELCSMKFRISPFSFWQVNRAQAERLYTKAAEFADLKPNEVLLDFYCGTGTIGLTMARKCKSLYGIEIVEDAIKDAKINAEINDIHNANFICSDSAKAALTFREQNITPDVVILDPPRKGCSKELVNSVAQMNPDRIVYVSCDPATLARDILYFSELGYSLKKAAPCDMFPRTYHVECVVLMTRK